MAKKRVVMWAGFVEGKIFRASFNSVQDGYGNIPSFPIILFSNKRDAKVRFEDVRRVEIREVQPATS